jgi:hypothetical protein
MSAKKKRQQGKNPGAVRSGLFSWLQNVRWTSWLLLFVMLCFAFLRFRLRDVPLERDEGENAYSGQLILQGIPPYLLAYNMKLPGTYAAYALIMAVFGQTSAGIHIGLLLLNAATTLLIFALARKLFGAFSAAFAGMTYALLSASPSVLGMAGHATHFVVFAAVAGILILLSAIESHRLALFFCSGSCLGLAFLLKQPGIVFSAFSIAYLIYSEWKRLVDWRFLLVRVGVLCAGIAWPFALTCLLLFRAGVFKNFWFWTFSYARTYAADLSLAAGFHEFRATVADLLRLNTAIWIIAACGLIALFWYRRARSSAVFVTGLLVFSFAGVSAGLYFRSHYFILLLPAMSLLCGLSVSTVQEFLANRGLRFSQVIPPAVFAVAFAISLFQQRSFLFAPDPATACRTIYSANPFLEAQQIGEYLKANSPPSARVAIFGSEPEIYFYAARHSATGYIYTYGLMEDQKYADRMQREMIDEVTRSQPEFLVFVDDELSWLWQPGGSRETFFAWMQMYINTQYEKTAQVEIEGSPGHLIDDTARIYVFRRNGK